MIDDLTYHYEDADHKTILINCHYPIDANSFVLQYGIIVKKSEALPGDLAMETAIGLGDFVKMGFEQDVEIWKNKARIDNPLLCEEDGPVYQLRRWYEQFYVDVADVAPDMVDRFEYELDTTSPNEEWMKVVDANLAARAAAGTHMTVRPDNRLRRLADGAGGLSALRCVRAGAQEQLESDQRAVGWRGVGALPRAPRRREPGRALGAGPVPGLFSAQRLDRRRRASRRPDGGRRDGSGGQRNFVSVTHTPVAVVTGASRGAGRGIAAALVAHGWRVYLTGRTVTDPGDGGIAVNRRPQ